MKRKSEALSAPKRQPADEQAERVEARCLCGSVVLDIQYPAFWAWHDSWPAEPACPWRGLCDICRHVADALPHRQGRPQGHALRGP